MQVAFAKRARYDAPHCGDVCRCWHADGKTTLCVIDGLGHGQDAEAAAEAAAHYVACHCSEPLADIFAGCDAAIRHTRGAAMGIASIDQRAATLTYAGIGNTRAMIVGTCTLCLASSPGIVGGGYRTLCPEIAPLAPGELVALYTDGLPEGLDLSRYSPALRRDVQRLAHRVIRDWARHADDAAVVLCRMERA